MKEALLKIIGEICEEKKSRNVCPSAALYSEISTALHKQVQGTLNELITEGRLTWHRTINSISFELKQQ